MHRDVFDYQNKESNSVMRSSTKSRRTPTESGIYMTGLALVHSHYRSPHMT